MGEYYVDVVKVLSSNTFSKLDQNETLLVSEKSLTSVEAGSRILLNYSYLDKKENGFSVKINGGSSMLCDSIVKNTVLIEQLTSEPILLETVWLGLQYLNVSCYVDFYSNGPVAALVLDEYDGQTCRLSFIYDKRKDPAGSRRKINASFDLSNVLGKPAGTKKVIVSFNNKERDKVFEFTY